MHLSTIKKLLIEHGIMYTEVRAGLVALDATDAEGRETYVLINETWTAHKLYRWLGY